MFRVFCNEVKNFVITIVTMNKDSQWLQLDVCREFQRNRCTRLDYDCKFAHPAVHVDVQNGKVIACYDSMKGRCNRDQPPCKYFHPPSHLNDQLLVNGRNHLALKNALVSRVDGLGACQALFHTPVPKMVSQFQLYSYVITFYSYVI